MRYVMIGYDVNGNTTCHVNGYLRIPETFTGNWCEGFFTYLKENCDAQNIIIAPIATVGLNDENMGHGIKGYTNLEDHFNMALRSNVYYPESEFTEAIRRSWSKLDSMSSHYVKKNR